MNLENTSADNSQSSTCTKLTLAHINDTHSYFEPTALEFDLTINHKQLKPFVSVGGFARIATRAKVLANQAKAAQRDFLFLHAGDCFQGTLYFSLFKGRANADLLNALNLDAMVLGNHELDMGNELVAKFLPKINFPLLAGNWNVSEEDQSKTWRVGDSQALYPFLPQTQTASYIVKQTQGAPVAIFGLSIDQMAEISNPDPDTPFENALMVAKNTVAQIQAQGIKNIILLSHLGYEADLYLASQVAGIGVIVGGHSHRLQGDFSDLGLNKDEDNYGVLVQTQDNPNGSYVVQAGFHAQALGHCHISFDQNGKVIEFEGTNELLIGRRVCLDASLQSTYQDTQHALVSRYLADHPRVQVCVKDPAIQALLAQDYLPKVREKQNQKVGYFDKAMRHVRIPDEKGPSELAPMVVEAFYWKMQSLGHALDFAIHNAGGVRASMPAGPITTGDIAGKLVPFLVPIGIYQIQGKHIAAILEGAINNALNNGVVGTGSGSYPYSYRLKYTYQADAPMGERILDLKIQDAQGQWQSIQADKLYWGSSSAYTMKGKEGYDAILNMQQSLVTNASMADCVIYYLKQMQTFDAQADIFASGSLQA